MLKNIINEKRVFYTYINNQLYFDSFTENQVRTIKKTCNEEDIIQMYEEENIIYIQLDYNEKIKKIISEK